MHLRLRCPGVDTFETSDGLNIAFEDWPAEPGPEVGPPVVLHHGFIADARLNWLYGGVVTAFTAAGRRVIGPDARGHGRSDKPHDPALYGEDRMSQDLAELLDHLGLTEIDLVGYSMGAIVALITASRDRRIRRLVIGGVGSAVVELGGVERRNVDRKQLVEALLADDLGGITDPTALQFREFADAIPWNDRRALAAQAQSIHRDGVDLASITAPTLLIVGRDDPLATRPEVLAGAIPGGRLLVVAGDHAGALGDPAFVPAMVEFLDPSGQG